MSEYWHFAQTLKVINRPLHFKDPVPSLYAGAHTRRVVIGESPVIVYSLHTQRKDDGQHYCMVGFRNMCLTWPDMKEAKRIGKGKSGPVYDLKCNASMVPGLKITVVS